jgi:hypothetical protein
MFDQRPYIGSTAFDRAGDGFVYYSNAWSKGIPVSAAARNAYLFGPRSEWFDALSGREATVARRPYWHSLRRILTAILFRYDPAEADA